MKTTRIQIERSILIEGKGVEAGETVETDVETAALLVRHGRASIPATESSKDGEGAAAEKAAAEKAAAEKAKTGK